MDFCKACSFFGHSNIIVTKELKDQLKTILMYLIVNHNFMFFFFGGFGMFDELAWQVLTELKKDYPHIKRIFCLSDEKHLIPSKRPSYLKDEDYEEFVYLPLKFDYWYTRIYYRNCDMVDRSDLIIFFVNNTNNSGAYKIYQYATKKKKKFINLGTINKKV